MTTLAMPFSGSKPTAGSFDIGPVTKGLVASAALAMSVMCIWAIARGLSGIAPHHPGARDLAIIIHVATVLPAIPLGAYLLLGPKGGKRHMLLGKIWLGLMLTTATASLFIQSSGSLSFIHLFVPLTLRASWKIVSSARARDFKTHKREIVGLYLGALMIPGAVAFLLPGRLFNVWAFGWPV